MPLSARAVEPAPGNLDIRQVISDLMLASKAIDEALVPVELADKIPAWEGLVEVAMRLQDSVSAAIQNTDSTISSLKVSAEKYQNDPAKSDAFRGRIDSLQSQSDQFLLFQGELEKGSAKLKSLLDQLKNDPEVKTALEVEAVSGKVDAALKQAEEAVPAFLQEQ